MYQPSLDFERTAQERADQLISWRRGDRAFFAAGACHILAWVFVEVHPDLGFRPVGLRLSTSREVVHVYASDDIWAVDHCGWTREHELLAVTRSAYASRGEDVERVPLPHQLVEFCAQHNHRLPEQYANDPRPRARTYLAEMQAPSG